MKTITNLMRVSEVSEILKISKVSVYRLTKNGSIPSVRIGKTLRIPDWAIQKYLLEPGQFSNTLRRNNER